jgi:hypothetical protein
MASLTYPTKLNVDGPLFLDLPSLRALDGIVRSSFERMCEYRTKAIAQEVQERKAKMLSESRDAEYVEGQTDPLTELVGGNYKFSGVFSRVLVILQDGGTVEGTSFGEIAALPRMQPAVPVAFSVTCQSGPSRLEVTLDSWGSRDLSLSVESDDSQLREEIFGRLEAWAFQARAPRWVIVWRRWRYAPVVLLYVWLLLSTILFARLSSSQPGESLTRHQAYILAKQGVSAATQTEAIQLILALESGYEPEPIAEVRHHPSSQFYAYCGLTAFILAILLFPPRGAIALWAGKGGFDRQKFWLRFVAFSFPSFLFSVVVVPLISRLFGW